MGLSQASGSSRYCAENSRGILGITLEFSLWAADSSLVLYPVISSCLSFRSIFSIQEVHWAPSERERESIQEHSGDCGRRNLATTVPTVTLHGPEMVLEAGSKPLDLDSAHPHRQQYLATTPRREEPSTYFADTCQVSQKQLNLALSLRIIKPYLQAPRSKEAHS